MTTESDFLRDNARARAIFTDIVERFMRDGEPVGSRTLHQSGKYDRSPAFIRDVMADLEELGMLASPHTSAGRLPTDKGMRLFVDGIMQVGDLSEEERAAMEEQCATNGQSIDAVFEKASSVLSGLSKSAGLVVTQTQANKRLKHIEFVFLEPQKAIVVLVAEDGSVENRPIDTPLGTTPEMLREAGTFLSQRLHNKTIAEMQHLITREIKESETHIDILTKAVIEAGLATELSDGKLIISGHAELLKDPNALQNIDDLRELYRQLESKEIISRLLGEAEQASGVKIFIGSENSIFKTSGHSLILSPYRSGQSNTVVGAIGVIAPTRGFNLPEIIPSVNFMAEMLARRVQTLG